nr:hypothetical protein [Escherichia coli O25b:H4-ST131]
MTSSPRPAPVTQRPLLRVPPDECVTVALFSLLTAYRRFISLPASAITFPASPPDCHLTAGALFFHQFTNNAVNNADIRTMLKGIVQSLHDGFQLIV